MNEKELIENINNTIRNWDGELDSLSGPGKEIATYTYLKYFSPERALEIFPECCAGHESMLLSEVYKDPANFIKLYRALVDGADGEECFESQDISREVASTLKMVLRFNSNTYFATEFKHILFRSIESSLTKICLDWYNIVQVEQNETRDY